MSRPVLSADCARCSALCCLALAFDASALFGLDKRAGEPCPHLDGCGRCGIYGERQARGFGGCVAYDCLGAGQRVTQELFGGQSWQEKPHLAEPMARAFAAVRHAHDLLQLLGEAGKLPLSIGDQRWRARLEAALTAAGAEGKAIDALEVETRVFLRRLRRYGTARGET
jgi:hypothetical protein